MQAKLNRVLRRRFEKAIKLKHKSALVKSYTGVTLAELRVHLEKQFQPGMTWTSHGFEGWHIDHIKPVSTFDLTVLEQRQACFHYTNLQPLWKKDNLAKGAKILV